MRPRALVLVVLLLLGAGACARLGAWQFGRWQRARAANAAIRSALGAPPLALREAGAPLAALRGRRLLVRGAYDPSLHVLLHDRWRGEQPGVEWLTPLRLPDGGVVLVDRGWLPAADGERPAAADLALAPESSLVALAEPMPAAARAGAWRRLPDAHATLWSADAADADSLRAHVPLALAPWLLHALPAPGAPPLPRRSPPTFASESMHLSYTAQWALFACACIAGAAVVVARARTPGR